MNVETIKTLINEAFLGLNRDEDCTLHQAQCDDERIMISRENRTAAKRWDPETDWRDIPAASLEECNAALSYASPQSWHFYLPAYMQRALDLIDTCPPMEWSDLPISVVHTLTYRDENRFPNRLERFHRLNEAQENAVVAFLEFVRDSFHDDDDTLLADYAALALRKYWAIPRDRRPTTGCRSGSEKT